MSIFVKQNPASADIWKWLEREICFPIFRARSEKYLAMPAVIGIIGVTDAPDESADSGVIENRRL